jgi:hypothetical protein
MTAKDFRLIAAVIRGLDVDAETRAHIANEFASALRGTNAAFSASLFFSTVISPENDQKAACKG